MLKLKKVLPILTILLVSTISSYGIQRYLDQNNIDDGGETEEEILIRPEFAMADLDGQIRNIKDWDGKVILLNFWATWCPPCLSEIPGFIELQEKYGDQGFQVIGIAVDNEEDARAYAHDIKINYPVMAAEFEAVELSSRYGNHMGALPFSVIINRKGEISDRITGELSKIKAEKLLGKLDIKS